jgi:adenine phosphoribosyltransferase
MFDEQFLRGKIRAINDYPKKGIVFRDITTLIKDGAAFRMCIDQLAKELEGKNIDYVVGVEARGFIFGAALAYKMGKGFVPVRKKGKLPYDTVSKEYDLEYASATIEMHKDSIEKDSSVVLIDDLLATGGTAKAAADLISEIGGKVEAIAFIVELTDLNGKEKLSNYDVMSLIKY